MIDLIEDDIDALAKAAQGLTMAEAELAFAKALVADNRLDRNDVAMRDKIADIRQRVHQCTVAASKPAAGETVPEVTADAKERPAQPAEPTPVPTRGGRQLDL
ncbi:MAG: hypothetical protein WCJ35_12410 [Planctomycetota bacterium]